MSSAAAANQPPSSDGETTVASFVTVVVLFTGVTWIDSIPGFFLVFILAMLAGGLTMAGLSKLTRQSRIADHDRYSRTWYCRQCGIKFEVGKPEIQPLSPANLTPSQGLVAGQAQASSRPHAQFTSTERYEPRECRAIRAARVMNPVQRAKSRSYRDISGLRAILKRSAGNPPSFDPCRPVPIDLGIMSRLASLGYLAYDAHSDSFTITPEALKQLEAEPRE